MREDKSPNKTIGNVCEGDIYAKPVASNPMSRYRPNNRGESYAHQKLCVALFIAGTHRKRPSSRMDR